MSEWISVEDRLPKEEVFEVLVFSELSGGYQWVSDNPHHRIKGYWERNKVTHWQPLQEPPTKELKL